MMIAATLRCWHTSRSATLTWLCILRFNQCPLNAVSMLQQKSAIRLAQMDVVLIWAKVVRIEGCAQAENKYTKAAMADTEGLQAKLVSELRGRIQEADETAPTRSTSHPIMAACS